MHYTEYACLMCAHDTIVCLNTSTQIRLVVPCVYQSRNVVVVVYTGHTERSSVWENDFHALPSFDTSVAFYLEWLDMRIGVYKIELYDFSSVPPYEDIRLIHMETPHLSTHTDISLLLFESYQQYDDTYYVEEDFQCNYTKKRACFKEMYDRMVRQLFEGVLRRNRTFALEVANVVSFMV